MLQDKATRLIRIVRIDFVLESIGLLSSIKISLAFKKYIPYPANITAPNNKSATI
jgi:hypothetical protein